MSETELDTSHKAPKTGLSAALAKMEIKTKYLIAGVLVLFVVLFVLAWQLAIAVAVIIGVGLLAIKIKYRGTSMKDLMTQKRRILHELEILEKDFMKRKLSKKDFVEIFRKKQTELIKLEALIDESFNKEHLPDVKDSKIMELAAKKRHIVQELLSDKRRLLKEMEITQKLFLKRKVDSDTYQKLIRDRKQKLVELEGQLKEIYGEESVKQVISDLKKRLSSVEKQRQDMAVKKRQDIDAEDLEIASEIIEQLRGID